MHARAQVIKDIQVSLRTVNSECWRSDNGGSDQRLVMAHHRRRQRSQGCMGCLVEGNYHHTTDGQLHQYDQVDRGTQLDTTVPVVGATVR